jgi:hypothetical protein
MSGTLPILRRHCEAMADAIGELLRALRPNGTCLICRARPGRQHETSCGSWAAIIAARTDHAAASKPRLFERKGRGDLPLIMP